MVRVEYVGVIAIACLLLGAMIGSRMTGTSSKVAGDTASQASAEMTGAMPDQEEINHLMQQIGSSTNYEALVRMGNAAMDQHMTSVAVAAYEKALTLFPNDPNVITDLGAVYRDQMKDSHKAIELFKKAAKLDTKHAPSRYNLGLAAMDIHDHKTAESALSEVIRIAPDSEQAGQAQKLLEDLKKHAH